MNDLALPRTSAQSPHSGGTQPHPSPVLESRLPRVGTTIFTVMSALASETGAVNLGQGFPDFNCDPALVNLVGQAMHDGLNQYPPMAGVASLRQAISSKIASLYGAHYDWNTEITVTAGATQAIFDAILCCVRPGDEVIVLEPAYDSYIPNILVAGAIPVTVSVGADFRVRWDAVAAAITPRTRAILVNSPNNPSGRIFQDGDLATLEALAVEHDLIVISDEVYEHMVYDGQPHRSACRSPRLAARSFIISSFGKTYHVTGWKVAYCAAPAGLMSEFRKIHQFDTFTVNTPVQHGLAAYMADPAPYLTLGSFYQKKRDLFREGLAKTRFGLRPSEGTYFQLVDYGSLSVPERTLSEAEFAQWLTREIGVAAIPMSAFYDQPCEQGVVRFCFAKKDETLKLALERLARL